VNLNERQTYTFPAAAIAFIGDMPVSFNIWRNAGRGILSVGNNAFMPEAFVFFGGMALFIVGRLLSVVAKVEEERVATQVRPP